MPPTTLLGVAGDPGEIEDVAWNPPSRVRPLIPVYLTPGWHANLVWV